MLIRLLGFIIAIIGIVWLIKIVGVNVGASIAILLIAIGWEAMGKKIK